MKIKRLILNSSHQIYGKWKMNSKKNLYIGIISF